MFPGWSIFIRWKQFSRSAIVPEHPWTFSAFFGGLFRGAQHKTTVAILYVCIAASLWKMIPQEASYYCAGTFRIVAAFVLFGLIPVGIVKFVFREKLADYGLGAGIVEFTVRSTLLMTPIMILLGYLAGYHEKFLAVYPLNPTIRPGVSETIFLAHLASYLLYYAGWEFLFRGFLLKATEPQVGPHTAVLIQTMASTMLHYGHPASEVFGAILGGLFWGFLAYRTRSILAGFMQHATLGLALDCFLVYGTE